MLNISTKGVYALEIVSELGISSDQKHLVSLNQVAARRGLSEKYLERIMKQLKKEGIVLSFRGANGGYCLRKSPEDITVKEVLDAVEGELAPVACLVQDSDCGMDCDKCVTRGVWGELWEKITEVTEQVTIEQIIQKTKENI